MNPVVEKIFSRGSDDPNVDLSGEALRDLLSAVDELKDEAMAAGLFQAMWVAGSPDCDAAIAYNIETAEDPGLLAEIANITVVEPRAHLPERYSSSLLTLASRQERHPIARAQALKAAYIVAMTRPPDMRRLQAHLLDLAIDDHPDYLQHAARIIGFILAHIEDDELRDVLDSFLELDGVKSEAATSLGMLAMADGLGASDQTEAIAAFERSLNLMGQAIAAAETRPDAELYSLCLTVLLDFGRDQRKDELGALIDQIRQAAFTYSATSFPSDDRSWSCQWMGLPQFEGMRWYELAMRIGQVERSFESRAWLHAVRIIEDELVKLYGASRSLLCHAKGGGIEKIIRPRISDELQRDRARLALLEQWLDENDLSGEEASVAAVRGMISEAMEGSLRRHPIKAAASQDAVAAALGHLSPEIGARAGAALRASLVDFDLGVTDPVLIDLWSKLARELNRNDDYRTNAGASSFFDTILFTTLSFAFSRTNLTAGAIVGVDYLFNRDRTSPPLEKDLQKDYFSFIQSTALRQIAVRERSDRGGGRADIDFVLNGMNVVAELKKTDADHDLEGLAKTFGLQTTAYQRSSYTFCVLMVLDLVDRRGTAAHIRERVSVQEVIPPAGKTRYSVVVVRIQGMLKAPNELK